jgi:hypothetical protein
VDSCGSHPCLAELKIPQAGEWRANTKSRPDFPGRFEKLPMLRVTNALCASSGEF